MFDSCIDTIYFRRGERAFKGLYMRPVLLSAGVKKGLGVGEGRGKRGGAGGVRMRMRVMWGRGRGKEDGGMWRCECGRMWEERREGSMKVEEEG